MVPMKDEQKVEKMVFQTALMMVERLEQRRVVKREEKKVDLMAQNWAERWE